MNWIEYKTKKPEKSSFYKVKAIGAYKNIKKVYYDSHADSWIYDDGTWLPVDIRLHITHWADE